MAATARNRMAELEVSDRAEPKVYNRPVLSVVLPIFNEEEVIPELYQRLTDVLKSQGERYEIVFVNDGSVDQSYRLLCDVAGRDKRVKIVNFARNFGHQIAITAGLDHSRGQAVVVMDADLQDPPEVLPDLIAKWREGYDVVYAVRTERQGEGKMKRGTASLFYRLLRSLTKMDIPADAGDFRLMSRRAVDALGGLREHHRFIRGLSTWIGFRQTVVAFVREARYAGETKYPLRKMVKLAFDGITSFSFAPLQLATYMGFGAAAVSFCYILYAIALKTLTDRSVAGWTSLIVSVLFIGGVQLITLGIIGEYIGRIYDEVKQRPLYLVADVVGDDVGENEQ
jgi:glycosyltransferase involved in cell wall biosynthesis